MGERTPAGEHGAVTHRMRDGLWRALGALAAAIVLAGVSELYLQVFPPQDYLTFLGEASPLTGNFTAHPVFGATYRSWEAFCAENAERMRPFLPPAPIDDASPIWAFFGNSFVQAPGMLADRARGRVHDRRIFSLGRNEDLFVRLAQIEMLLEHGMRPERIFIALMPVDLLLLGAQPLATIHVTAKGAVTAFLP